MTSRATPEQLALAQQLIDKPRKPLLSNSKVKIPAGSNKRAIQDAMLSSGRFSLNQIKKVAALSNKEREVVRKDLIKQGFVSEQKPKSGLSSDELMKENLAAEANRMARRQNKPDPYISSVTKQAIDQQKAQEQAAREVIEAAFGV